MNKTKKANEVKTTTKTVTRTRKSNVTKKVIRTRKTTESKKANEIEKTPEIKKAKEIVTEAKKTHETIKIGKTKKIIVIVSVLIVILLIIIIISYKHSNNNNELESSIEINKSLKEKTIQISDYKLDVSEFSFENKDNICVLSMQIVNNSHQDINEEIKVKFVFLDANNKELYALNGKIMPIKRFVSRNLAFSISGDYSKTKSIKIEVIE